jgi:hypothetical protein
VEEVELILNGVGEYFGVWRAQHFSILNLNLRGKHRNVGTITVTGENSSRSRVAVGDGFALFDTFSPRNISRRSFLD